MPLLMEALDKLSKDKPENPIEFIAQYMLDHNPERM
jgi:predicted KAP-like P-loop ATPase